MTSFLVAKNFWTYFNWKWKVFLYVFRPYIVCLGYFQRLDQEMALNIDKNCWLSRFWPFFRGGHGIGYQPHGYQTAFRWFFNILILPPKMVPGTILHMTIFIKYRGPPKIWYRILLSILGKKAFFNTTPDVPESLYKIFVCTQLIKKPFYNGLPILIL